MSLHVGFIEPHLKRYGGIRRVLELGNALVARGHRVTYYLPPWVDQQCDWMRCDGRIAPLDGSVTDELDLVLFNHEPQWYLLDRFPEAERTGFYALHDGSTYAKAGSWEAANAEVDLRLANSRWTAERLTEASGEAFQVLSGGINPAHFRPLEGIERAHPLLCVGDERGWKGTDDIEAAARQLGLPLERYAGKDLPQSEMAREYASAEVFVVGSHVEGFGQPGLEALACGTPLVTTDNGGCRDYAEDEVTALVVPPRDPSAMADAIARLRRDPALAERLRANGLETVRRDFSWAAAAERLESLVAATPTGPAPVRLRHDVPSEPELSVVVLQWNNLGLTQDCVETVRRHTDVSHELVVVDNGSEPVAEDYARLAADRPVLNGSNLGFAQGMNAGLAAARGRVVAFCNNDITLPPRWAGRLVEALDDPRVGMVVPALTAANNEVTVRSQPGTTVETLPPFSAPPSGVVVVMRRTDLEAIDGWSQHYPVASGEDVDLGFTVWTSDREIVCDTRVLVDHVGHATSDRLPDRERLWAANRRAFLDRWKDPAEPVARLAGVDDARFARNRATAAAAAGWMDRYFRHRDLARSLQQRPTGLGRVAAKVASVTGADDSDPAFRSVLRRAWSGVRDVVPSSLRARMWPHVRTVYYRYFPERHPAATRAQAGQ